MSPERFLEQFGYLAEAPNGIAKLRELILQLAVRGELVPQDPNDEPASVLLERIGAEKDRLVAEKKIKKTKQLPTVDTADIPFVLPTGWEWARLASITLKIGSGSTPRGGKNAYVDSGIVFLRSQNIWNDGLRLEDVAFITDETHEKMVNTHVVAADILLNITGASLGRCALVPAALDPANVSQPVTIIRPVLASIRSYLHKCLLSPFVQRMVWGRQVGMAREGLSKRVLEQFEIPVPPVAEQSRIVAKVDQLMVLCDELEAKQNQRAETHGHLIRAALQPLTQPRDHAEFLIAWQRIRDNFDSLHTTIDSIKALRQTILQLAVQGKLVPQDPNDEPASVLLEKIKAEKERLVAEGRIKKTKPLPAVDLGEVPFELPAGWEWTRFGAIFLDSDAGWSPRAENRPASSGEWGVLKVSAVSWGEFRFIENKALPSSMEPRPQYEVKIRNYILSRANTADLVARSVVVETTPSRLMMSDKIIRLHLDDSVVNVRYLNLFNNSSYARSYYSKVAGGTSSSMKNVSRKQIALLPVALPPKPEQQRIVVRIDQLMALCDELEEKIEANQTMARHFAEAVVAELAA